MQEAKNVCAVCYIVAKCSGCEAVYYCGREHQKSHWKTHLKNCRPYKLVENAEIGRHYVARRNIKIGETVLSDKRPLLTAPVHHKGVKKANGAYSVSLLSSPVCLGCYVELRVNYARPCCKCGWHLCTNCQRHGTECAFTIRHRKLRVTISVNEYGQPHPAYEIIGVIRALALRENDPIAYRKLMNLEDNAARILAKEIDLWNSIVKAARFVKTYFKVEDVEEAEICKIIGIGLVNAHSIKMNQHPCAAVYDRASYIEHNCLPNCSKSFDADGGVVFWAASPISKGDHITTTYVNPRWGTKKRREYLSASKFFDCTCERCQDPTEFDTMFNAIKCPQDKCNGYALPPTFLVTGGDYPEYVCRECSEVVPRHISDELERRIELHMTTIRTDNVSQYREFLEKWRDHLHDNNFYLFCVEIEWATTLAYTISHLHYASKETLTDIVNLCTKLTARLRILAPAEHPLRATILYLKFQVAVMKLSQSGSPTVNKKLECAKKFEKDLNEVQELLLRESACHGFEYSMRQNACRQLEQLKAFSSMALSSRS